MVPAAARDDAPTFGLAELGVHRACRWLGIARRLHDALLADRSELRFVLWVRTDAPVAAATYQSWGYRPVGTIRGSAEQPCGQVLCLYRGATR